MRIPSWILTLAVALITCPSARAQLLDAGETGYTPIVDEHRFALDRDRILSPRDPRLLRDDGRSTATFEFHLTRSWSDSASPDLAYCVAYIGGRAPRAEAPVTAASATASSSPAEAPAHDPYAEPTTVAAPDPEKTAGAGDVFWPHLGLYVNSAFLFAHSGDQLLRCALSKDVRDRLERRERVYFAMSIRPGRLLVHADGRLCAQFKDVNLQSMEGVMPLPDHDIDQLVLGTRPSLPAGRVRLLQETDGRVVTQNASYDLDRWLRNLDGKLGGVRYWSRAFAESYVADYGGRPALAQRGHHDVTRNIAFPTARDGGQPSYADLVVFSDFAGSNEGRHRMRQQFPASGNWVNDGIEERIGDEPPGLDDSFGNVVDRPLITIVPTASREHWFVYEDANLHGVLHLDPDAENGFFRQSLTGEGDRIPVRHLRDELRFELPKPGRLFGGNDGRETGVVTLRRPHLDWLGSAVDRDNPFWNSQQLAYINVPFRAFDITNMDPLYAYQGKTGTSRRIFDEPTRNEYRLNNHKVVVPAAFHYCPVDRAYGSTRSVIAQNQREYTQVFASHKGAHIETISFAQDKSSAERWQSLTGGATKRFVGISRSIVKKFALVVNRSQARLSPRFLEACHELADRLRVANSEDVSACRDFIEAWGTHFAMGSVFGGMMVQERVLSEVQIQDSWNKLGSRDVKVAAGLRDGVALGAHSVNLGKNEIGERVGWSSENGSSKNSTNSTENVRYWLIPGDQLSPGEPTASPVTEPVPLFFDLRPLHELLTPANFDDPFYYHDVRVALRQAIREYVAESGAQVPAGEAMQPWLADLGKVQPMVRFASAYTDSHVEGMLNLHTYPQKKSDVRVDIAPSRKDELGHQRYALFHKTGRSREQNPFRLDAASRSWVVGDVTERSQLQKRLANHEANRQPLFRAVFQGAVWIPPGNDFTPPRPQPYRVRVTSWPGRPKGGVVELFDQIDARQRKEATALLMESDLPAPGQRVKISRRIPLTPQERMPGFTYGNGSLDLPVVEVVVEFELELKIIKEPVQPPDLGAGDLERYRQHVAELAKGKISGNPAAMHSVLVRFGDKQVPFQIRRLIDRSELVRAYESALLPDARAASPITARVAEQLLARLRHAGLPREAFLLEWKGATLGAAARSQEDLDAGRLQMDFVGHGNRALPVPVLLDDGRIVIALDHESVRIELRSLDGDAFWGATGAGVEVIPTNALTGLPR